MNYTKNIMMLQALESGESDLNRFGSNVVYKKYLRSKRGRVSNFLLEKMKKFYNSLEMSHVRFSEK